MRNLIFAGLALVAAPVAAQTAQPVAVQAQSSGAATSVILASGVGQVNSVNFVNGATAGFAVLYDSATVPTDGALVATQIRWCMPIAINTGIRDTFGSPLPFYSGLVAFVSPTSCTTKAAATYGFVAAQVK